MKLKDVLTFSKGVSNPDAIWLAMALFGMSRSQLQLSLNSLISAEKVEAMKGALRRRERGEPLQYIVGSANFYGREFFVDTRVLIPRPETERLVEIALSHSLLRNCKKPRILDLGTGSGAIGITLKLERPDANVICTDLSAPALAVARKNAQNLGADVVFERGDKIFGTLQSKIWDLVISNPPYVSRELDWVSPEVKKWEPDMALYPEKSERVKVFKNTGTFTAHRILEQCSLMNVWLSIFELSPTVAYTLERHWKRHKRVANIFREADFNQRKRFLIVEWTHG